MSQAASLPGAELFLKEQLLFFSTRHLSGAASLPGADVFSNKRHFFEQTTCPGQLRCLGQMFFQKIDLFLKKALVPGSFAAWGGTFLKKRTFRNSGIPVRRTRCRKSKHMDFQEFWDSCAQNKASEISKHILSTILGLLYEPRKSQTTRRSRILGLLCAEQNVENLKKNTHVQEFLDSCAQDKTSEI